MPDQLTMDILDIMKQCSLFKGLTESEINSTAKYFTKESYEASDVVFTDGSFSDSVYFVVAGSFEIVSYNTKYQNSKQLRILKPGEYFSELSVLTKSKHHSSAFAIETSTLLRISATDFNILLKSISKISINLITDVSKLIFNMTDKANFFRTLSENTVIIPDPTMMAILPMRMIKLYKVIPLRIEGNHLVIGATNPVNTAFYQEFSTSQPTYEIRTVLIDETQYQAALGDMYNFNSGKGNSIKPAATIKVPDQSGVGTLIKSQDILERVKKSPLLAGLNSNVLNKIIPFLEFQTFGIHQSIFSPQHANNKIYLILSGSVRVLKKSKLTGGMMPLYKIETNESLYDVAIFNNEQSTLTARSTSVVEVCAIPKNVFSQLLNIIDFTTPLLVSLALTLQKINKFSYGVSVVDTFDLQQSNELKSLLPLQIVQTYKVIAINRSGMEITVATPNPTNRSMITAVEKSMPHYHFNFKFVTLEKFYLWRSQLEEFSSANLTQNHSAWKSTEENPNRVLFKADGVDAVKTFELIIENAIDSRASDVHIEILENFIIVRYRVDGELIQLWENLQFELGQSIVRRSKLMAGVDIAETRIPQGGKFRFKYHDQEYGMRLSSIPTRNGEKVVLRITGRTSSIIPLRHLSQQKETVSFLKRMTRNKQGIFLVSGPTGSGKSTTLYSMLNELNRPGVNIITVEDPIEINISGVNQVETNPAVGLTHDVVLKHILRQDPDVIFIGEIRDAESMQLALDASMTGHMVLSTIHANSSLEILPRLKELVGNSTTKIASTLLGAVAQRLVRVLCEQCKVPHALTADERVNFSHLGTHQNLITEVMTSVGCPHCNFTGFKGRIPLFEHWEMTQSLRNLMLDGASTLELTECAKSQGFESLEQYGMRMVAFGLTTIKEVKETVFGLAVDTGTPLKLVSNKPEKKSA